MRREEGLPKDTPLPDSKVFSGIARLMGRRGGMIGGKRRLETMTAAERSAVARKAAKARWAQRKIKFKEE
jgi:hypothetical protein